MLPKKEPRGREEVSGRKTRITTGKETVMRSRNRFGEPVHVEAFTALQAARTFTKMLGRNPTRFSLVGMHRDARGGYQVVYRARSTSPWKPDPRATWPKAVAV